VAEFWNEEEVLESGEKNKAEKVELRYAKKKEKEYYDVRSFFKDKNDETQFNPSTKGVAIPRELAVKMAHAILQHEEELTKA
jgi:hypothetical protein